MGLSATHKSPKDLWFSIFMGVVDIKENFEKHKHYL